MNKPNAQAIQAKLEERRRRDREARRRHEQALDALAVEAVQSLTMGLGIAADDVATASGPTPVDTSAKEAAAARAIEVRRAHPAASTPTPRVGEAKLRAALRAVIEDYAEPLTPADNLVRELHETSDVAVGAGGPSGLWAEVRLADALAVRAAMRSVVEAVTTKVESIIIADLVAAEARFARDYPDAPWPDAPDADDYVS